MSHSYSTKHQSVLELFAACCVWVSVRSSTYDLCENAAQRGNCSLQCHKCLYSVAGDRNRTVTEVRRIKPSSSINGAAQCQGKSVMYEVCTEQCERGHICVYLEKSIFGLDFRWHFFLLYYLYKELVCCLRKGLIMCRW